MADVSSIQDPRGAIALKSSLLGIQWVVSGATQCPIWLQGKGGAGKASGKRRPCEFRRAIPHRRGVRRDGQRRASCSRLDKRLRLDDPGCGKFGGAELG